MDNNVLACRVTISRIDETVLIRLVCEKSIDAHIMMKDLLTQYNDDNRIVIDGRSIE